VVACGIRSFAAEQANSASPKYLGAHPQPKFASLHCRRSCAVRSARRVVFLNAINKPRMSARRDAQLARLLQSKLCAIE
jgi:hypothetical protein